MASLGLLGAFGLACARGAVAPVCGAGTHDEGGTCVITLRCGPGTHSDGVSCLVDAQDGGVQCGAGTHQAGAVCVADPTDGGVRVTCGAGTHLDAGTCSPDPVVCVGGTHLDGDHCLPDEVCATGTHDSNGQCVADGAGAGARFEVRLPEQTLVADGISKVPVLAIGTAADGSPSTAAVVLGTTLTGAAALSPGAFSLSTVGTQIFLTPCSSNSPGCSGVFQVTLALASAPNAVVARSWPLTLQAPAGVGSAAPCRGGGNVLFYDGDSGDYIHPGTATITQGNWSASGGSTPVDTVRVHVTPSNSAQGLWWDLEFSSRQVQQPLAKQVYLNAERSPFASPGHPGIDIGGDGRGCNTIAGRFQVEDLQLSGSAVTSFTATFEQHCEGQGPALRGCVHFGP